MPKKKKARKRRAKPAPQLNPVQMMRKIALDTQKAQHTGERKQLAEHQGRERKALAHQQKGKRQELRDKQRRERAALTADQKRERDAKRAHQKVERREQRTKQRHERSELVASFRPPKKPRRGKSYAEMAAEEDFEG